MARSDKDLETESLQLRHRLVRHSLTTATPGLYGARFESNTFDFATKLVHMLQAYVLEEELGKKIERVLTSYPETWWDAFKLRFFPRWALRRWPAKWHVERFKVTVRQVATYPRGTLVPELGEPVIKVDALVEREEEPRTTEAEDG